MINSKLTTKDQTAILEVLKARFQQNMNRHKGLEWNAIENKLKDSPEKLWSLNEMDTTGGEPDVVDFDVEAQESRKKFKPKHNVRSMAIAMGIDLMTEEDYRKLQKLGKFDTKTSSWIWTPDDIRKLGGALFADFRYGHVFVYHNGADSYYASRGFRGTLRV